jgi:hypothetical protein
MFSSSFASSSGQAKSNISILPNPILPAMSTISWWVKVFP